MRLEKKQNGDEKQLSRSGPVTVRDGAFNAKMRSSSSSLRFPSLIMKREEIGDRLGAAGVRRGGKRDGPNPFGEKEIVRIKDLTWSDKELVLRVLFAKLNESKVRKEYPTHEGDREGGRNGEKDSAEPLFFISEGAIDFLPSDIHQDAEIMAGDYDLGYNDVKFRLSSTS